MDNPWFQALVLGLLQGLTEFLPVSSSGHLAVAQMAFGVKEGGLTLGVMLHAGTLGATTLLVWARLREAVVEGVRSLMKPSRFLESSGGRDALFVVLASIPTAVIGLILRDTVESWTGSATAVGVGFLITGVLLASTLRAPKGEVDTPRWWGALLVGIVQGLAVFPGISRSGSTIAAALWLRVAPGRAFELSMLMSLPAVLGALLLEMRHFDQLNDIGAAILGAAVAFVVGLGALWLLRRVVLRGRFAWFVLWVWPLGVATLLLGR